MRLFGFDINRDTGRSHTYKVGLALSGGGARGFAHAGAIEAMIEVGLKPEIVCGVSAGSVVAVMHAAGIPPKEMVDMFTELKFSDLCNWSVPTDGFFRLDKFKEFLRKVIPYERLEDLPMPAVVCASNFDTGKKVAFRCGVIADCVAASCCIPIVFKPEVIGGTRYVDGGVIANLPAWAIRDECKFLVGVNCSPVSSGKVGDSILQVAMRSYEMMAKNNAAHDMELCDMVVRMDDIARYKVFDLKGITGVFEAGYRSTMDYFLSKGVEPHAVNR